MGFLDGYYMTTIVSIHLLIIYVNSWSINFISQVLRYNKFKIYKYKEVSSSSKRKI